jgi:5-methylthioadenosine/S-adenosylhomocysteine deaminase
MIDTLIHNGTLVTVDADFSVLSAGAVAIRGGEILKVWVPEAGETLPTAIELLDARGGIVMPGLINAHTHLPMALFRGLADDLPLQEWLERHMFPAEAAHISPESVKLGAGLACAEMLLGGTTTCCDGYFLADAFFDTVASAGMRAVLGQGVIDFPAPGVPDPAQNVPTARAYAQKRRGASALVQPSIFCHSPYTCSASTLTGAKQAAAELGLLFQIHVAETRSEREQIADAHGCTPVRYLEHLGLLDARTLLVHAVWVDPDDIEIIARCGARVAHCPESNMKLASGVAPVPDFMSAGIAVGLGTDGCASNNDLDLWGEMDTAAKLHKVHRLDPTVMDAAATVRMATGESARALGLDGAIGSLEPGKRADVIVIDTNRPHLSPLYHPASHLVYAGRAGDVRHVMVDGRWVVRDGEILTMDVDDLVQRGKAFGRRFEGRSVQGHGR